MTDKERADALLEVLSYAVSPGGMMNVYEMDPDVLPPDLLTFEELDRRGMHQTGLPKWRDR